MFSSGKWSKASLLVSVLSLLAIAPLTAQSLPHSSVGAQGLAGIVAAADGDSCQMKQGQCEVRCQSAGGANAAMNACFQQCQAEMDACQD